MSRRKLALALALAAVATLPALADAAWTVAGEREPNTVEDWTSGFMWHEPDARPLAAGARVYFNALPMTATRTGGGVSLHAEGARLAPPGHITFLGYLGMWKDCNHDGYVGHHETALVEYSANLGDSDVCAAPSRFNDGRWMTEFVWIGPSDAEAWLGQARHFRDDEAAVWGDFGRPGDAPRELCHALWLEPGASRNTGGLIGHADCQLARRGAATLAAIDPDDDMGLRFDDPHHPERDCAHPLNHPTRLYAPDPCDTSPQPESGLLQENSERRTATVWDCSQPDTITVDDPLHPGPGSFSGGWFDAFGMNFTLGDDDGHYVALPAPRVGVDPGGSAYDAVNHTERGALRDCEDHGTFARFLLPHAGAPLGGGVADFWSPSVGAIETGDDPNDPTDGKRRSDFRFRFEPTGWRNYGSVVMWSPKLFGLAPAQHALGDGWFATTAYHPPQYLGGTLRDDLQPAGALWATMYAYVGGATTSVARAPDALGLYGAEWCGTAREGVVAGWDCDARHWEQRNPDGTLVEDVVPVHAAYRLRDVDCMDGHLAAGAHASLVLLSAEGPCPAAPEP